MGTRFVPHPFELELSRAKPLIAEEELVYIRDDDRVASGELHLYKTLV
jgi:hypothetical protein